MLKMWQPLKNSQEVQETIHKIGLYGASGHAKVIVDILKLNGFTIGAILDDNPLVTELLDYQVTHAMDHELMILDWVMAIGNNHIRQKIVQNNHLRFTKLAHPRATIDTTVLWGEGTVIMAGAVVNSDAMIGRHVIINTGACVDHDCQIGDFCHIAPNSTLCGSVKVGEGTLVGAGATIIPGVTVGKWCIVGAGSVVIHDINDNQTVVGNPARKVN